MKTLVKALLTVALLSGCETLPGTIGNQAIDSDPSLGILRGILRDAAGKPVPDVRIKVYKVASSAGSSGYRVAATDAPDTGATLGASAKTHSDGSFVIPNVPTGEVTVEAVKSDDEKAIAMNVAVAAGVEVKLDGLTLAQTGAISGKVKTTTKGADLFGTDVFIPGTSFTAKTDEEGNYTILYVPAGKFRLAATMPGFNRAIAEGVEVASGKTTTAPDLTLANGAKVTGLVDILNEGSTYKDVEVTLHGEIGTGISKQKVYEIKPLSPDGTYSFEGVPEGDFSVTFRMMMEYTPMIDQPPMMGQHPALIYYPGNDKGYSYLNAKVAKSDFGKEVKIGKVGIRAALPQFQN